MRRLLAQCPPWSLHGASLPEFQWVQHTKLCVLATHRVFWTILPSTDIVRCDERIERNGVHIAEERTNTHEAIVRQPIALLEHPCAIALGVALLALLILWAPCSP
jgi:hypothetical protein